MSTARLASLFSKVKDIGFEESFSSFEEFQLAISEGSFKLLDLCHKIAVQIVKLAQLDFEFTPYESESEREIFCFEFLEFLKLRDCPCSGFLKEGKNAFEVERNWIYLLEFLIAEFQAESLIILQSQKPDTDRNILKILTSLGLPSSSSSPLPFLLSEAHEKLKELLSSLPQDHLEKRIFSQLTLDEQQLKIFEQVNGAMQIDYSTRRAMLLKRLDLTLRSFFWQERKEGQELHRAYLQKRKALREDVRFSLYDVLNARADLMVVEKTNSIPSKTKSIAKDLVLTEEVPDRGGRTEQSPQPTGKKRKGEPLIQGERSAKQPRLQALGQRPHFAQRDKEEQAAN